MITLNFPLTLTDRMLQIRIVILFSITFLLHYLFAYIERLDKICIPQIFELMHTLQNILMLCREMINNCQMIKQRKFQYSPGHQSPLQKRNFYASLKDVCIFFSISLTSLTDSFVLCLFSQNFEIFQNYCLPINNDILIK